MWEVISCEIDENQEEKDVVEYGELHATWKLAIMVRAPELKRGRVTGGERFVFKIWETQRGTRLRSSDLPCSSLTDGMCSQGIPRKERKKKISKDGSAGASSGG